MQLGLALAALGVTTSLVAQHIYALNPYAFLSRDYATEAALYTHHQYIAGFLMVERLLTVRFSFVITILKSRKISKNVRS
jgi:hypothetical protein